MQRPSIRQVMSLTAVSSLLTMAASVLKIKVISVYFGPVGVGLVGLMQSLFQLSSLIVSNGMTTSGTKKFAEHTNQHEVINQSLFFGLLGGVTLQSLGAFTLAYFFSEEIVQFLELRTLSNVYFLSLGVLAFSVFSVMHAIFVGMRKIKQLVIVQVSAAILGSLIGVALSLIYGEQYLVMCVVATPIVSSLLSFVIVRKQFNFVGNFSLCEAWSYWLEVNRIGGFIVVSSGVSLLAQTILKSYIARYQGLEQLGYYQAAITISTTYLSVIIVALTNDYLPRISELKDKGNLFSIVNKQISIVGVLAIPIVFMTILFAPNIISILYSSEYSASIALLRLLTIGDLVRCFSITLAYTLLAENKLYRMLLAELVANSIFLSGSILLLPDHGVIGIGYAYCMMYFLYFPLLLALTSNKGTFLISMSSVFRITAIVLILILLQLFLNSGSSFYTAVFCVLLILISPIFLKDEFELMKTTVKQRLRRKN